MFVIITQLVLLLCAWCTQTYDIATPEVNFLIELEKIKNFQERVKTTETTIEELNRETGGEKKVKIYLAKTNLLEQKQTCNYDF